MTSERREIMDALGLQAHYVVMPERMADEVIYETGLLRCAYLDNAIKSKDWDKIAVMAARSHSSLTTTARAEAWKVIRRSDAKDPLIEHDAAEAAMITAQNAALLSKNEQEAQRQNALAYVAAQRLRVARDYLDSLARKANKND